MLYSSCTLTAYIVGFHLLSIFCSCTTTYIQYTEYNKYFCSFTVAYKVCAVQKNRDSACLEQEKN